MSERDGWPNPGTGKLLSLLGLPAEAGHEEIRRAFRDELKRVHPDTGPGDASRLGALLAAREQWQQETGGKLDADTPSTGAGWFTPQAGGPQPRSGFWERGS